MITLHSSLLILQNNTVVDKTQGHRAFLITSCDLPQQMELKFEHLQTLSAGRDGGIKLKAPQQMDFVLRWFCQLDFILL